MQAVTKSFKNAWRIRCRTRRAGKERKWLKRQAHRSFRRYSQALCNEEEPKKTFRSSTEREVI